MRNYLQRYDNAANKAASQIISCYSTSFCLATQLLSPTIRADIRNLYAMVRIADEIVDGTARAAHDDPVQALRDYEALVLAAPDKRFHTDPVLHAYAVTARRCKFPEEHIAAFFRSMREDLLRSVHDGESFEQYIYGSAEVIGLLCLHVFFAGDTHAVVPLEPGARALGAAFQKINFLRDLAEDSEVLGRSYFPRRLDEKEKAAIIADIRKDLARAHQAIPLLPTGARRGVAAAAGLFEALTNRLENATIAQIYSQRIRVPRHEKLAIVSRAILTKR